MKLNSTVYLFSLSSEVGRGVAGSDSEAACVYKFRKSKLNQLSVYLYYNISG